MGPEQRAVILIYFPTRASAKEGILIKINARGGGPIYSPQTADNIQFYLLRIEIRRICIFESEGNKQGWYYK